MEKEAQDVLVLNLEIESLDDLILKEEDIVIEVLNKSKSGLILPDIKTSSLANTPMISWQVVLVGDEKCRYPVGCKILNVADLRQLSYYSWGERNFIKTTKYNISLAKK